MLLALGGWIGVWAPPASRATVAVSGCAWATQVGNGGIDAYAADLNAAYWVTSFLATPGTVVTLDGAFPRARYASISAYNTLSAADDVHVYDAQIQPASGSNPFQTGTTAGASGTYHVVLRSGPASSDPASNTLTVGTNDALVLLVYRVYDPDASSDPTGGAGLPQLTLTFHGVVTAIRGGCVGSSTAVKAAARKAASLPAGPALVQGRAPARPQHVSIDKRAGDTHQASAAAAAPAWTVADVTRLPNTDANYLEAQINDVPGQVVVIRAQMPTYPNTNAGAPPWEPAQVRYWSLCDYGQYTLTVASCVADHSAVESAGTATFVISTPADQPSNATAAKGVNWLAWPGTAAAAVAFRQILPQPSFAQSIAAIPVGGAVSTAMGSYYPQIAYCSVAEFQSAGAAGCLAAPTSAKPTSGKSGSGASHAHPRVIASRAAIIATLSKEITPTGNAARIGALLKAHGYLFPAHELPERGSLDLTWWYAHRTHGRRTRIGTGRLTLATTESGSLHVRLTRAGRKLLRHHARLKLTATLRFVPTGHTAIVLKRAFTLRSA